jgi:hypothetical protein
MSINENIQGNQLGGDTKVPKSPTVPTHEAPTPDKQMSDKFPKWDILPPNQFINPRIKKTE